MKLVPGSSQSEGDHPPPVISKPRCSISTSTFSTSPTICPSYITTIRSESARISSRSSLMSKIAVPLSRSSSKR